MLSSTLSAPRPDTIVSSNNRRDRSWFQSLLLSRDRYTCLCLAQGLTIGDLTGSDPGSRLRGIPLSRPNSPLQLCRRNAFSAQLPKFVSFVRLATPIVVKL